MSQGLKCCVDGRNCGNKKHIDVQILGFTKKQMKSSPDEVKMQASTQRIRPPNKRENDDNISFIQKANKGTGNLLERSLSA